MLVLVADAASALENRDVDTARAALAEEGAQIGEHQWLAPGKAVELPTAVPGGEPGRAVTRVRHALANRGVDVALVRAENRRKRLLVADMDSTIVIGETLDELADAAGLKEKVAAITARAMNGEIDFKAALRERVGLLAGLPATALDRTYERVRLTPGARTLVRTMRANGAYTLLVSGGFRFFTGRVRDLAGFHEDQANDLLIEGGRLTGRVVEPILDRDAKLAALHDAATARQITVADALAVGDGANDLAMIQAAGLGVAFHAKPIVAEQAQVRIDHGDLTSLLYLQGYRRDEFIE